MGVLCLGYIQSVRLAVAAAGGIEYEICSLADAVPQREPRYLSCVEIDTRINRLRVSRAPLAFLRLSRQGSRVAKGSRLFAAS